MIAQGGGGKIIGAASMAAHKGFAMLGHYSASKWGPSGSHAGCRAGVGAARHHGQRLLPGDRRHKDVGSHRREARRADGAAEGGEEALAKFSELITARVETPEDLAAFVSYLASPDSNYMTGQSVMIHGGVLFA
jgi:meso-butanediol dehydrogenase / (S,S)-butanediol dehydrogenase / diacetyl reductase